MGNIWSTIKQKLFNIEPSKALILGQDASGKTTLLFNMSTDFKEHSQTIPTIGFTVEKIKAGNLTLQAWDVPGQLQVNRFAREAIKHYYDGLDCLIYMVDASTIEERGSSNKELFHFLVCIEELPEVPILILANKQDIEGAKGADEIETCLDLSKIGQNRRDRIKVFAISGKTGEGVDIAFTWLASQIK